MPASAYDPISSALKNSFYGGPKKGLGTRVESNLQKSMLVTVNYDDPVKQVPSLSPSQKSKYTILNPDPPSNGLGGGGGGRDVDGRAGSANNGSTTKLDQVPDPKLTLFRRDQVELGYKHPAGPGAGMFNMGNTCYLNSTLQALFHTPAFVNYLRYGGHENSCNLGGQYSCTICLMAATLRNANNSNVIKPMKIYEKLKLICKHLTHGRQEDAHEFLRYLVESLQKCYLVSRKLPKNILVDNYTKETTPFNQIFGGYMRQDVTCMRCRHISTTFQHFMDLLLDIRQADNIDSALQGYFRRENLGQGENMYKCEKCQQKVPATKQYKIERPPLVLCIQLKRFNLMGGKNGRPVTLARKINISNHVRWAASKSIAVEYRLVSMINHVGPSPNCGHYTSIGEAANGTFYRFDDASVHPTSLQSALHTSAYVIFYEMTKPARDAVLATSVKKATPSLEITKQAVASSKLVGPSLPSGSNSNSPRIIGPSNLPSTSPASASSPLIGPRLPPQQKNKPALISEPVKSKQPLANPHQSTPTITAVKPTASSKLLASPLVKPKVPVVEQKAKPQQVGGGGLVPYGSDSDEDSDEADSSKPFSSTKPIVNGIKPAGSPQIGVKPSITSTPLVKPTVSSPFLPRSVAANLKKLQEAVKEVVVEKTKEQNAGDHGEKDVEKSKTATAISGEKKRCEDAPPNRDPSSEALYSPSKQQTSSRNEFTVTDLDAHNPSVHSDNSTGSTTSFTVTEMTSRDASNAAGRNNSGEGSVTSRQRWRVSPTPSTTPVPSSLPSSSSSVAKPSKTSTSVKRERSVPPEKQNQQEKNDDDDDQAASDTELMGSPKKRKKTGLFDGHLLEKVAGVGKDVWSMGSKLSNSIFKPKKVEAETTCEATTSHQDDKACSSSSSSIVTSKPKAMAEHEDGDADDEEERRREKEHKKKKKKKKYHDEREEEEVKSKKEISLVKEKKEEEGDVVKRVKHSSFNPDIVAKKWDEKPDMKSIGRSNTWDGSKSSNLLDTITTRATITGIVEEESAGSNTEADTTIGTELDQDEE